MLNADAIKPDLMVHVKGKGAMKGAPGVHVGTVDHMEGSKYIKLTKADAKDGRHHWIPLEWVESADNKAIYLNKTLDEFNRSLINENPGQLS